MGDDGAAPGRGDGSAVPGTGGGAVPGRDDAGALGGADDAGANPDPDTPRPAIRVGVLALQGDVAEHEARLRAAGAEPVRVRRAADLDDLDALILPGGESTTIGMLATDYGLVEPLRAFVASGRPVWGTCAGLILLARDAGRDQPLVGGLDVAVARNAFGRQVDSFEADVDVAGLEGGPFRAVFIRAPAITSAGPGVDVLARLDDGTIVAVRQGRVLATAFHAELGDDARWHQLFLGMVEPEPGERPGFEARPEPEPAW